MISYSTTKKILGNLVPVGVSTAATTFNYLIKEAARDVADDALKSRLKDLAAFGSSTINSGQDAILAAEFLEVFIRNKAWTYLSRAQLGAVATCCVVATVGSVYSLFVFGHEKNLLAAGITAGVSATLFKAAKTVAENRPEPEAERSEYDHSFSMF